MTFFTTIKEFTMLQKSFLRITICKKLEYWKPFFTEIVVSRTFSSKHQCQVGVNDTTNNRNIPCEPGVVWRDCWVTTCTKIITKKKDFEEWNGKHVNSFLFQCYLKFRAKPPFSLFATSKNFKIFTIVFPQKSKSMPSPFMCPQEIFWKL